MRREIARRNAGSMASSQSTMRMQNPITTAVISALKAIITGKKNSSIIELSTVPNNWPVKNSLIL